MRAAIAKVSRRERAFILDAPLGDIVPFEEGKELGSSETYSPGWQLAERHNAPFHPVVQGSGRDGEDFRGGILAENLRILGWVCIGHAPKGTTTAQKLQRDLITRLFCHPATDDYGLPLEANADREHL